MKAPKQPPYSKAAYKRLLKENQRLKEQREAAERELRYVQDWISTLRTMLGIYNDDD